MSDALDAARYRYLRDHALLDLNVGGRLVWYLPHRPGLADTPQERLDNSIDQAMKENQR